MTKLEELKELVAELFDKAEDKTQIQNSAKLTQKIDEVMSEQKAKEQEYNDLLKDYKEVIIHTSFKPTTTHTEDESGSTTVFDANAVFTKFIDENTK